MSYLTKLVSLKPIEKYTKIYTNICLRAQHRATNKKAANLIIGYNEKHHILPKSFNLGGEQDAENYAFLTLREHFICHKLLIKMFPKESKFHFKVLKAITAFMMNGSGSRNLNSHQYEFTRKCLIKFMTENNPMTRRGWSAEERIRNGNRRRGIKNNWSQENRQKQSKAMTENNPMTRRGWSAEERAQQSKQRAGKSVWSDHVKQQQSQRMLAENNPNFGKIYTAEEKAKRPKFFNSTGSFKIYNELLKIEKRIFLNEYEYYLNLGYTKGCKPMAEECKNNIRKSMIGKFTVINNTGHRIKITEKDYIKYKQMGYEFLSMRNPLYKKLNPK